MYSLGNRGALTACLIASAFSPINLVRYLIGSSSLFWGKHVDVFVAKGFFFFGSGGGGGGGGRGKKAIAPIPDYKEEEEEERSVSRVKPNDDGYQTSPLRARKTFLVKNSVWYFCNMCVSEEKGCF